MQQDWENLWAFLETLEIDPSKKQSIRDRMRGGHVSKKLFDEIDQILQIELEQAEKEVKNRAAELAQKEQELQTIKMANEPKKREVLANNRKRLKKIYEDTLMAGKEILQSEDLEAEESQKFEENKDIQEIKDNL